MKSGDITAIDRFDTKKHMYLCRKGIAEKSYLSAQHVNLFGRICMKLRCGPHAMPNVIKYLTRHINDIDNTLEDNLKLKLNGILTKYEKNHKGSVPPELLKALNIKPLPPLTCYLF